MSYAVQDDVLARAGRFAGLFTVAGKRPNLADIDAMLATVTSAIDVEIKAHGYDPAVLTDDLVEMLRDVNAWAVLVRALPEASPGDNAIADTVARGTAILTASGFPSLAEGGAGNVLVSLGAIAALEAGSGGGGPGSSAGSFWDELPEDWMTGRLNRRGDVQLQNGMPPQDLLDGLDAAPQFRRGQSL